MEKEKPIITASEIMNKQITIPCYLCGKGKITIRQGDIGMYVPHPLDRKVREELEKYLLKATGRFFAVQVKKKYKRDLYEVGSLAKTLIKVYREKLKIKKNIKEKDLTKGE